MTEVGIRVDNLAMFMAMIFMIIAFLAWMVRYKAKAKERLLIIEKNYDADKLMEKKKSSFDLRKTGIILLTTSIGAIIGFSILVNFALDLNKGIILFISIFMFAGIGMIIASRVDTPKEK